jgi:D-alanyl-D-alanine carboxypeptidase-like protein
MMDYAAMPQTLGEQQRLFVYLVAKLILWTYEQGWQLSFGEAYRTPEQAALNEAKGIGIKNSLHTQRLAIDLNLFMDGIFKTNLDAYRPLGQKWKSLHPLCRWGGDFHSPDADHFSMEYQGVK